MYTRLDAVIIDRHPHIGVLVHLPAVGIEHIVVVTDLREALGVNVVGKVVGKSVNIDKSVADKISVFIAPVLAILQRTASARGGLVDIAAGVLEHLAYGPGKDDATLYLDRSVVHLAVLTAPVRCALVGHKAAALAGQQAGLLIEVIPIVIGMVVLLMREVAVGKIAFAVHPIGSLIKNDPLARQEALTEVVASSPPLLHEGSSDQHALVVEHELLIIHRDRSRNGGIIRRREVVQIRVLQRGAPAGVQLTIHGIIELAVHLNDPSGLIAAPCANRCSMLQIAAVGVLPVLAGREFLGIAVHQLAIGALGHNGHAVVRRLHGQIYGLIVTLDAIEVVGRVVGDVIALFAGGAADEVHNAIFIHYAVRHGLGAGIGVIVSGEHEINPRLLRCRGQIVMHERIPCLGIGAVGRYVHGQHLPAAGGCLCILHQPIKCLLILSGGGVVDHRHIDVAVFNGVVTAAAGCRQIVHGPGDLRIHIAVELVVTQNVDHIHAVHHLRIEHLGQRIPVGIPRAVVHGVAGLDGEVIRLAVTAQRLEDLLHIGGIGGLRVADDEEVGLAGIGVHGELQHIAPGLAVAHRVVVGRALRQTGQFHRADTGGFRCKVDQLRPARMLRVGSIRILGGILGIQAQHSRILGRRNMGQPCDALAAGRCIVLNVPGGRRTVTGKGMNDHALVPGTQRIAVLCAVGIRRHRAGLAERDRRTAIVAGNGILRQPVHMDGHIGHRSACLIRHRDIEGIARHGLLRLQEVMRLYRHVYRGEAEAVGKAAFRHRGEAAGGDAIGKGRARRQRIGDPEGQPRKLSVCRSVALPRDVQRQLAGTGAIGLRTGKALGKGHLRCAKDGVEPGGQCCRLNIGAVLRRQCQRMRRAQIGSLFHRLQRHGGVAGLGPVDHEIAGLVGLVAVIVADTHPQRVQAVCQMDIGQDHQVIRCDHKAKVIHHVDAVDVCADGLEVHAGGILAVVIRKGGGKGHGVVAQHRGAVPGKLRVRVVVIHGGDDGIRRILVVIAVDKLDVIHIDAAGSIAIGMGHEALGDQADGVVAQHLEGAVALAHQTGGHIDPAPASHLVQRGDSHCFAVFIRIGIAVGQINGLARRLDNALEAVAGRSLGYIDPHTQRRRRAGSIVGVLHIAVAQHSGGAGGLGKVVAHLQGLIAEAHRLAAVDIHDLRVALGASVTAQAKMGGPLLLDGHIGGALHHQGAVILLRGKVLGLVDDVAVRVRLDLPDGRGLSGRLIGFGHLFPDLHHLHSVLIVPEHGGQLTHGHHSRGLQHLAVLTRVLRRHLQVAAEVMVGGKGGRAGLDPADLCGVGHAGIVGREQLHIPCKVAALIDQRAALTLHQHGHIHGHVEAQRPGCLEEGQAVRLQNGHGVRTAHLALIQELCRCLAHRTVGGKHALLRDATHGVVRQLPCQSLCRKLRWAARLIHTSSAERDLGCGRIVIGSRRYGRMVEHAVADGVGNHQKTAQRGTLRAVGGNVLHRQIAALALGKEGGGTAAVAADRVNAAQIDQRFRQFTRTHAHRNGVLAAHPPPAARGCRPP